MELVLAVEEEVKASCLLGSLILLQCLVQTVH